MPATTPSPVTSNQLWVYQCDLCPAPCGQCKRAQLTCSGYRDIDQLRIHDETRKVATKASASNALNLIRPSVGNSLDDPAKSAFFSHYVTNDLRTYSYLQTFYSSTQPEKHLASSVDAVSLAFFAHLAKSPLVLKRAIKRYVSALNLINRAIQSPSMASRDDTLLAAMLLDLFEKMTNQVPHSESAWTNHITGAFGLIRLRGNEQFQHAIGIRMLMRVCTNLLISCVASYRPIPPELVFLRGKVSQLMDSNNPKWRLMGLIMRFVELRHADMTKSLCTGCILDLALDLDNHLDALSTEMPPTWQFDTVHADSNADRIYRDYFHVYPDVHVTQTWNVLRLTRILINQIIKYRFQRSTTSSGWALDSREPSSYSETVGQNIENLASEICASAPQYIRQPPLTHVDSTNSERRDIWQNAGKKQGSPSESLACYTLLFPLFIAAQSASSASGIKEWVLKQLRYMSNVLEVRNADLIAGIVEGGADIDPWSVYAMLGGYAFAA